MTRMGNETKTAARAVSAPEQKVKDRILVVEDEDNARRGYELMLRGWGYEVLGCPSAEEVLERYAEFRPAALLADIGLPLEARRGPRIAPRGPSIAEIGRASCRERV